MLGAVRQKDFLKGIHFGPFGNGWFTTLSAVSNRVSCLFQLGTRLERSILTSINASRILTASRCLFVCGVLLSTTEWILNLRDASKQSSLLFFQIGDSKYTHPGDRKKQRSGSQRTWHISRTAVESTAHR